MSHVYRGISRPSVSRITCCWTQVADTLCCVCSSSASAPLVDHCLLHLSSIEYSLRWGQHNCGVNVMSGFCWFISWIQYFHFHFGWQIVGGSFVGYDCLCPQLSSWMGCHGVYVVRKHTWTSQHSYLSQFICCLNNVVSFSAGWLLSLFWVAMITTWCQVELKLA